MSRLSDTADLSTAADHLRRAGSTAAVGIAVIGVLAGCSASTTGTSAATDDSTGDTASSASDPSSASTASSADIKDGTYTETGDYQTPGGTESVTVTLTLASGAVTKVSMTGSENTPNSKHYVEAFESGISSAVVGKKISTLNVGAISGSSLTPNGFNAAVAKILTDATKA